MAWAPPSFLAGPRTEPQPIDPSAPGRRVWQRLLWWLVFPRVKQRFEPTVPGVVLIALSMGVGMAAYNSANNILFITLSLLLACLILSGVMSAINLRKVRWTLRLPPPVRAGQTATVTLDLANGKSLVPAYGLWFELRSTLRGAVTVWPERPKGLNLKARRQWWKDRIAALDRVDAQGRTAMRDRLDPHGSQQLPWSFTPDRRGLWRVELASVGSLFPFGFLRKFLSVGEVRELVVWPALVEYRRWAAGGGRPLASGNRATRVGHGADLLAVRKYAPGDSHRLVHWKASARTGQLLVRQYAAESQQGYALAFDTSEACWPRAEQFELAVSLAATLAEDLFRAGQLRAVSLDAEPPCALRGLAELEEFLGRLAVVARRSAPCVPPSSTAFSRITLQPDGPRGVVAMIDGQPAAQA